MLFVAYLVDKNRRASTIKSYISAIKKCYLRIIFQEVSMDRCLLIAIT